MESRRVRFVLVRPSNALNIGAVARAMANFGFDDLAAVGPYAKHWRSAHSAIYGSLVLERARVLPLKKALSDRQLVLGTASAHNRAFRRAELTLPALGAWLRRELPAGGRLAVLFGSERSGLSNEELDHCHALLRIPTDAAAPSMNLGQAAALVAYELSRPSLESANARPPEDPPNGREIEGLVETALRAMAAARVNEHLTPEARRARFRRGLLKWKLSREDAAWLRGLLDRLSRGASASRARRASAPRSAPCGSTTRRTPARRV
ncbi:MAG: RNA methyltransferase [Elusimicrobia bacterium]|nr:RNA methyltransferase [Elusimicrobiota bacterium]